MLRPFVHPVACCWMLLRVVAQSLKPVKLLATYKRTQQLPTMLGVVGQQCCIRLLGAKLTSLMTLTRRQSIKGLLNGLLRIHLRPNVITLRNLLHLGQNVFIFRTSSYLGTIFTFRPSTPFEVSLTCNN